MFALKGSSSLACRLQASLIKSAKSDCFSRNKISHNDGWGGVWYSKKNQLYLRTTIPIFKDKQSSSFFRLSEKSIFALSHARKAAPNEPIRGPFDSHPFSTHLGEELVYLTHNGHIDKNKLRDRLGLNTNNLNDTEVFTFLLQNMQGDVESRLRSCINLVYESKAMLGALNIMVLSIKRQGEHTIFYYSDYPMRKSTLYYRLYSYRQNLNNCVMSSTVAYNAGFIDLNGEPITPEVMKVSLQKLRKLH